MLNHKLTSVATVEPNSRNLLQMNRFTRAQMIMQSPEHYLSTDNYLLRSQKLIQNFMKFATKFLNTFLLYFSKQNMVKWSAHRYLCKNDAFEAIYKFHFLSRSWTRCLESDGG